MSTEQKTKITALDGQHDLTITREFDLPVGLLFRAHTEAEFVSQWMDNTVNKLDARKHGAYEIQKTGPDGTLYFKAHGVFHDVIPNEKIVRTFEMMNAPFDTTLEFMTFESLGADRSKLTMHVIYRSGELRDANLKLPFAYGINMAHSRLEEIMKR